MGNIGATESQVFISVVMAVYNGERFLQEAIESVLVQTHQNFEFIIIDDGSSDNTAAIIKECASADNRIHYYYQENAGVGAALNFGDGIAKAEYIARMDSDDIMLPDRLQKQISFLQANPEASAVSCLAYYINSKGRILGQNYSDLLSVEDCKNWVFENKVIFCLHPGAVFRKEALMKVSGYNTEIVVGHDTELWNRLADRGFYTIVMPELLMKYRIHQNSLMSSFKERSQESAWVHSNIRRRRNNEQELSFWEFNAIQRNKSILHKLSQWQIRMAHFHYRKSGLLLGEKNYFPFLFSLVTAFTLNPRYVIGKIRRQVLVLLNHKPIREGNNYSGGG